MSAPGPVQPVTASAEPYLAEKAPDALLDEPVPEAPLERDLTGSPSCEAAHRETAGVTNPIFAGTATDALELVRAQRGLGRKRLDEKQMKRVRAFLARQMTGDILRIKLDGALEQYDDLLDLLPTSPKELAIHRNGQLTRN